MNERDHLLRAIELAVRGQGHTRPNPAVGAVVVKGGRIVGAGYHHRCGAAHAEVEALRDAGAAARGATLYVTLEPCSRPGRVGACTDAIAAAGVKRVVYAVTDPNPKNRGRARRILAKHGIVCERFCGDREVRLLAENLIRDFRKRITTGLPYVLVKLAMSLDGRICDLHGASRWISSDRARDFTDGLRGRFDAIMVGAETVRRDNPSLLFHAKENPDLVRVVVTRSGRLPKDAQIFTDGKNETIALRIGNERGAFPTLEAALRSLAARGIMSVLCEGGLKLARSLATEGLVDEWVDVMAPCVIGERPIREAWRGRLDGRVLFSTGKDVFVTALAGSGSSCRYSRGVL